MGMDLCAEVPRFAQQDKLSLGLRFPTNKLLLADPVFIEGHADSGVHADSLEGANFARGRDASRRNDGKLGGGAQGAKPTQIGSAHCAFAIDVGAQKGGAERFEDRKDVGWLDGKRRTPTMNDDAALCRVERHDDVLSSNPSGELFEKQKIRAAAAECGTADDDLFRAEFYKILRAVERPNTPADTNFHFVILAGFDAQSPDEAIIVAFAHGGVEIDYMQPLVIRKSVQ